MRKLLEQCPTCESTALQITELRCAQCATVVRGQYQPTLFDRLSAEDLRFLEIFVKNRGNVKEMERELEISYWTVRSRLDEVIGKLGFEEEEAQPLEAPADEAAERRRQAVLDALEAGEISVAQAAEQLDGL